MDKKLKMAGISVMSAALLLAALPGQMLSAAEAQEDETELSGAAQEDFTHLTVGTTTPFDGAFFTDMWGSATSDLDVRALIHGCSLVEWKPEDGTFGIDESVVSSATAMRTQAGDHVWLIALYDDLVYSDGTPITAWDYAFSVLLSASPQAAAIGADVKTPDYLDGYEEWAAAMEEGEAAPLTGVKVLGDQMLQITIRSEYLPFFYELALLDFNPYPVSVIAPGCAVRDDGEGVYIANLDETIREPLFTPQLLEETILDPQTGYLSHPSVTSGPYVLTEYDETKAEFEKNEFYKGDSEGNLPMIDYLTYMVVENDAMVEMLSAGELNLINKCSYAQALADGMKLVADSGLFAMENYARSGLSMVSFCTEKDTVSTAPVRQAIAYCLDRDLLTRDYVANYGIRVDGYYGVGQWMYQIVNGTLPLPETEDEAEEAAEEELSLDGVQIYEFDPQQAAALLAADGWTKNQDGEDFDPETDTVRCKYTDDETLTALDLTLGIPEGSRILDSLDEAFVQPLALAGVRLTVREIPMDELLHEYYRQTEPSCDMLYLATNFDVLFDPTDDFTPETDAKLYELAQDLIHTEPGDVLTYCEKWVRFQERFAQVLPVIPVYSNVYFDFYTRTLHDYHISANVSWGQAVTDAYLSDIEAAEEETETEDDGDMEIVEM